MNILLINKFFYIEGGAERYYTDLAGLLKIHGHNLAYFSIHDPRNFKSKCSKYFVSNISFQNLGYRNIINILKRMIYSIEAKEKIKLLLDNFTPDIVHIHSIYNHISPSILPEIKRRNIPIIQTVHDYHMLAPNRNFFHNNQICEVTKKDDFYKAIFHKCIKNSYTASFLTVLAMYIHKYFGLYSKYIDYYIAPSQFMKMKMVEYGFDPSKIIHLPYFVKSKKIIPDNLNQKNKYILYFGRLSPEKGLLFLIDVIQKLPNITFKIVGEGQQEYSLKDKVKKLNLHNIEFLGFLSGHKLTKIISSSYFTILPAVWYENLPNSILESFTCGRPVIGTNIGGIPELVKDYETGLLFRPNDVDDCVQKIKKLWNNPKLVSKMGINARKLVETNFNSEDHYKKIMKIYKMVIKKNKMKNSYA